MDKPASVRRVELRQTLIRDLNASNLPPYVLGEIVSSVLTEINDKIDLQYKADLQAWVQAQRKEKQDGIPCSGDTEDGGGSGVKHRDITPDAE